jgi:hypothetical protein
MNQNDKHSKYITVYPLPSSTDPPPDKIIMDQQLSSHQRLIVLDPRRPSDRQRLARILAQIAWRLAKEQAVQDVVSSQAQQRV